MARRCRKRSRRERTIVAGKLVAHGLAEAELEGRAKVIQRKCGWLWNYEPT
jgi:hypothetical protein